MCERISLGRTMPTELPIVVILTVVAIFDLHRYYNIRFNTLLAPIILSAGGDFIDYRLELGVLLDENLAEVAVLIEEDRLQADEFQKCQEHGNQRALATGVAEQPMQRDGTVFHGEAAAEELDHLAYGNGILLDIENRAGAEPLQDA